MKFYIIIPAHNEEDFIELTLESLSAQTLLPKKVVVVNDHSTDKTADIVTGFAQKHSWITLISITSSDTHLPGSKIINAFNKGLETLDDNYDVICKFDADLIFPENYLETLSTVFHQNPQCGMAGGLLYIQKNEQWQYENIAEKYHLRGPVKAYRKACFEQIGGLKKAIGWDTADVLLAQFYGWQVIIKNHLEVKHLKPTGKTYNTRARFEQGKALYTLRYGWALSALTGLKMAFGKRKMNVFFDYLKGYYIAKKEKTPFIVSKEEGQFIRNFRWNGIFSKFK